MPLMDGLIHSYNQATVGWVMNVGVANLIRKIEQLGVDAQIPAVPATLLGAVELTPIGGYTNIPVAGCRRLQRAAAFGHGRANTKG